MIGLIRITQWTHLTVYPTGDQKFLVLLWKSTFICSLLGRRFFTGHTYDMMWIQVQVFISEYMLQDCGCAHSLPPAPFSRPVTCLLLLISHATHPIIKAGHSTAQSAPGRDCYWFCDQSLSWPIVFLSSCHLCRLLHRTDWNTPLQSTPHTHILSYLCSKSSASLLFHLRELLFSLLFSFFSTPTKIPSGRIWIQSAHNGSACFLI